MISKIRALIIAASIGLISSSHAQSLDVGGVELALGQSEEYAREQLSKFYSVSIPVNETPDGAYHHIIDWSNKNKPRTIGGIFLSKGKITTINKDYVEHINNPNFSVIYAIASADIESKGGKKCSYKESSQDPSATSKESYSQNKIGYIQRIHKMCGVYELIMTLPTVVEQEVIPPSLTMKISGL